MTLAQLRDDLVASECNKAEQVIFLITASIESGIDNGSEIVATVSRLGYKTSYVGLMLSKNAGSSAERYHWFRNAEGHYQMHS